MSNTTTDVPELACPACTFLNPAANDHCMLCRTPMDATPPASSAAASNTASSAAATSALAPSSAATPASSTSARDLTAALFNFNLRGGEGDEESRGDRGSRRGGRGGRDRDRNRGDDRDRDRSTRGRGRTAAAAAAATTRGAPARGQPQQIQDVSSGTRGTWAMQSHGARIAHDEDESEGESGEQQQQQPASHPADSSSMPAPLASSDIAPAPACVGDAPASDELDTDEHAAAEAEQRQLRGLRSFFERAPDGSIVRRRAPTAPLTLASKTPAADASPLSLTALPAELLEPFDEAQMGFPTYAWRQAVYSAPPSAELRLLVVAEKPSIALSIASALSSGDGEGDGDAHEGGEQRATFSTRSGATPIHSFSRRFGSRRANWSVTSVMGHMHSVDFEPGYEDWESQHPGVLFRAPLIRTPARAALREQLQREARGVDILILALDADREGDNIAFEVMEHCVPVMSSPPAHSPWSEPHPLPNVQYERSRSFISASARVPGNVLRARFSALTPAELRRAFDPSRLGPPDELAARAVDARQELDLRVGVAFTRLLSLYFLSRYPALASLTRTVSYGPCQTPTLQFCVARADEIERHVPETFWSLRVAVRVPGAEPASDESANQAGSRQPDASGEQTVSLQWERASRLFDRDVALLFQSRVQNCNVARVDSVDRNESRRTRPNALNTVELLKVCSRALGLGPHEAMRVAEGLYLSGFISYPRTESSAYPPGMDLSSLVRAQASHELWGEFARNVLQEGVRPRRGGGGGVDAGDHPPITPLRCVNPGGSLRGTEWKVYDYVSRHFLASVSSDATIESTTTRWSVGSEQFTTRRARTTQEGFLGVMPWLAREDDPPLELEAGQSYPLCSVELIESQTTPPGFLSESDLIGLMERHGIGTDASIPQHVRAIQDRGFVSLGAGRTLRPTVLGRAVAHGLARIDAQLVSADLRGAVERELGLVATGVNEYRAVLAHVCGIFARKFAYLVQHVQRMDELFAVQFEPHAEGGVVQRNRRRGGAGLAERQSELQSQCGRCKRWMKLHTTPAPPRLHCGVCDLVLPLPAGGLLRKYMSRSCPLDGFELLLFTTNAGGNEHGMSYTLCPYCYSHPPSLGTPVAAPMSCAHCPSPTCAMAPAARAVAPCPESARCGGLLVLDPAGGPNWKLHCNNCNVLIQFAQSAHRVIVDSSRCSTCQARLLEINFHRDFNPLVGGTQLTACLFCNALFRSTSELVFGDVALPEPGRDRGGGGRGGRGGRGDGGRGGGRGRGRGGRGDQRDEREAHHAPPDDQHAHASNQATSTERRERPRTSGRERGRGRGRE